MLLLLPQCSFLLLRPQLLQQQRNPAVVFQWAHTAAKQENAVVTANRAEYRNQARGLTHFVAEASAASPMQQQQ